MESAKDGDSQNPQIIERKPSSSSSSSFSSSSSTSSFNSLIDINEFENEADIIINGGGDVQSSPTSPQTPVTLEETHSPPTPTQSLVSEIAEQSFVGYNPSRIPSSVFSRKTGGQEWSVASNESLFSIHMGNNSFSLGKSGELLFPYDLNNPQIGFQPPPPQSQPLPPPPPPQKVSDDKSKNISLGQTDTSYEEVMTKPPQIVVKDEDKVGSLDGDRLSATSTTHLSEESGNSSNSFVFPLLLGSDVANSSKTSEPSPTTPKPSPSSDKKATASPPRTPPERVVSLPKKEEEKVEKSNTEQQTPGGHEETPGGNKTWLSYFSCFSFCPIKSWQCFGRPNRNETETKN